MVRGTAPALPLALVLGVGVVVGRGSSSLGASAALLGVGLAVAAGGRAGRLLALATLGWALGHAAAPSPGPPAAVELARPVTLSGEPVGGWRRSPLGWRIKLRVDAVRQGKVSSAWRGDVWLLVPPGHRPDEASRWAVSGYLKRSVQLANGGPRASPAWRLSVKSRRLMRPRSSHAGWSGPAVAPPLRNIAEAALTRPRRAEASAVARALLLGDPSALPSDSLVTLRRLGLGHLLAVSGLHVGLVVGMTWIACLRVRPRWRVVPCGLAVFGYLALVGARPSLVRSSVMVVLTLSALGLGRRPNALNSWAVAVGLMILSAPAVVADLGFQLTAAATAGLLTLGERLRRDLRRLPSWLASGLASSLAAHVATLPWSLIVFHQWTPGAIVLNLVAVPWTACLLALSLLVLCIGWAGPPGEAAWWLLDVVTRPLEASLSGPVAGWIGGPASVGPVGAVAATGSLALGLGLRRLPAGVRALLLVVPTGALALPVPAPRHPQAVLLDVGQGESVLLRDGATAALIDGGGGLAPGLAARELAPALHRLGISRLGTIVLTHPDLDHCGGLVELTRLLPIDELRSGAGWDDACYRRLVRRPGLRLRPVWEGARWNVGRWRVTVLHPPPGARSGRNERSLVLRARLDGVSLLLTGDTGGSVERRLVARYGAALSSAVLKVGHHGSARSTSKAFLAAVRPRLALVSSGAGNVYGHPTEETLRRLESAGARVLRTDTGGQVVLTFPGGGRWRIRQPWIGVKAAAVP